MKKIICHGDSLTQGADLDPAYRWPSLLGNAIGVDVVNTGIGGDSTGGMLARFPMDVTANRPDLVILTGGTNDLWWDLPVNAIASNLFTMAFQAQYHGITPVLGLPLPIHVAAAEKQGFAPPEGGYANCTEKMQELMATIRHTAKGSEIHVVDFHGAFLGEKGTLRTDYFLDDGLHANREGHRAMALEALQFLRDTFLFKG